MNNFWNRNFDRRLTRMFPLAIFMIHSLASAHSTVQESGELLKPQQWQLGTELQLQTNKDEGVNVIGRLDKGFSEEANLRFVAGAGTTDFFMGGYFKWVPFPDYGDQPAIGLTSGVQVAKYSGNTELMLRLIPFISKQFHREQGDFMPFLALPIGFSTYDDESYSPIQFVLGSRYQHPDFEYCAFTAEVGFDLNDSFSYVSVGAVFPAFESFSFE